MLRHIRPAMTILSFAALLAGPVVGQASSNEIRAAVDSIVHAALERGESASYQVGVKRGREVIVAEGYGSADLENDIEATSRTVYRLGSITKQFTAAAIMQLVEQGKISLDDELIKFLPDYPTQGHRVTIDHLLTHTSGIKSYTGLGSKFWDNAARDLTHEQMLELFKDEPFDFAPGERYQYNNSGFYLLGMIVEQVAERGYDEYLDEQIFGPLELSGSSYCHEHTIIRGRAEGYRRREGGFVNDLPISMNTPGAAGALCSTVGDLMWWQDAFNNGRVVSAESREKMITPATLNNGSQTSYGYGLGIGDLDGHKMIAHGGGIHGFNTQLNYFPEQDLTVVVLANTEGSNPGRLARDISRIAIGIEAPEILDLQLSRRVLERYPGTYEVQAGINLEVTVRDGGLHLSGPGITSRLKAQGDDVFVLEADPDIRLEFEVRDGRSESVAIVQGAERQAARRISGQ